MKHKNGNGFPYYLSLDEAKEKGFTPIKVRSLLEFYTLRGRTTNLIRANYEPIPDLKYCVLAYKNDEQKEDRYYVRTFAGYPIGDLYFYERSLTFSGEDESVESLRQHVQSERVWLLLNKGQITHISKMLERLWNANLKDEGKVSYRCYIRIAELSLKMEDFTINQKNITGYKTAIRLMEEKINNLWKAVYNNRCV